MARSTKEDYTHQQDVEQLNQTLMSLKERYVDNRRASIPSENEAEFWAYRLILAPIYANTQLENELHRLPSDLRHNPRVKIAIDIFRALKSVIITNTTAIVQTQSNWKRFWELIKSPRVSYLMACAAEISFNRMRHVVLDSIWRAYRQGTSKRTVSVDGWTPEKLKDAMGLDSESEAVKHCEAYGFIFSRAEDEHTYLDFTLKGYATHVLPMPPPSAEFKPQIFSASIVEAKRFDRALSSVIQGISVHEARVKGLIMDSESYLQADGEMEDEQSLFVPEAVPSNANPFLQHLNGTTVTPSSSTPLNFDASPFQPSSTPAASTNPFLKAASQHQNQAFATPTVQPGLFNAAKNPIQFAVNGDSSNTTTAQFTPARAPANPFIKGPSASATPQGNPFAQFATPNPTSAIPTTNLQPVPALNIPGLTPQGATPHATPQPAVSFTPTGPPPQVDTAAQEAEQSRREAAEKQKREAERQQQEAEARQRAQAALAAQRQARAAEEAEQQRRQAEAAQQRQREQQQQEEQQRRANEERDRVIREAQQRQAQEEEARAARIRQQESTLHSLTADIMFHRTDGLMLQFIENATRNVAQEVIIELEKEKNIGIAEERFKQHQMMLKRAGLAKIISYVEKKKRAEQVRERRRRVKAQRAQMAQQEEEIGDVPTPTESVIAIEQPDGGPVRQRPVAPPSARRTKRTEQRRGGHEQNGTASTTSQLDISSRTTANHAVGAPSNLSNGSLSNGSTSILGYSNAYHQSTAPIDRTETDWFKLRAMGIDPSKHRKRSFGSSSGEEEVRKLEPKRAKISPPPAENQAPLQPAPHVAQKSSTADDQLARFRAVQEAFRKSASSPPRAVDGASSVSRRGSMNGSASDLIARARALVAGTTTPKSAYSPSQSVNGVALPYVRHDWGRSVPNLGFTPASSYQPALDKSVGASNAGSQPAYWQRKSRFVPRQLYGKGVEAIAAYNAERRKNSSVNSMSPASTELFEPSSLIPTQESCAPIVQNHLQDFVPDFTQNPYSEGVVPSAFEVIDFDAAEDESAVQEETYGQEWDGYGNPAEPQLNQQYSQQHYDDESEDADSEMVDDEDEDEDEEECDDDEDEESDDALARRQRAYNGEANDEELQDYSEYTEDEDEDTPQPDTKPAQPANGDAPGATEDDAIELSD